MKKKNKTLIIIELIVIGLLAGLIAYMIITARNQKIETKQSESESKTKEEIVADNIKKSFEKGIEEVKLGKTVDFILCKNVGVDCTKIKDFNILATEKVDETDEGIVFKITYEWSCNDDEVCFYNEQYSSDLNTNGRYEAFSHYLTDKNGKVKEGLGNVYIKEPEVESSYEESQE